MPDALPPEIDPAARQRWMAVLARASAEDIAGRLAQCVALPAHARLRGPEFGLVMLRGRAGGGGQAFNLGEATVTRCTVQAGDRVGHGTVLGRDRARAELAARVDAALQDPERRAALERQVIGPLEQAQRAARAAVARRAAATRVDFFTMATMRS